MKKSYKILFSAGAGLLAFPLSAFSQLLVMPLLGFAGFMGAQWGLGYLAPVIAGVLASLLFTGLNANAVCSCVMFILFPLIIAVYGKKKLPHRYAALALLLVMSFGLYLSMTASAIMRGAAPYEDVVNIWHEVVAEPMGSLFSAFPDGEELGSVLYDFADRLPDMLMWGCVLSAEFFALGLILFYRVLCKAFKIQPAPMAEFTLWRLPKSSMIGLGISALAVAAAYIFKLEGANSFAFAIGIFWGSVFACQGLATLLFLFRAAKAPKVIPILTIVLSALSFPWSLAFLGIFGIREQISKRRQLFLKYAEEMKARTGAEKRAEEYAKYGYIREPGKDKPENEEKNDSENNKEE